MPSRRAVSEMLKPVAASVSWMCSHSSVLTEVARFVSSTSAVTSSLTISLKYRYTGAALTSNLAWLLGAALTPLVALGLSANFRLGYLTFCLLSGAVCTLAALRVNRALVMRD